MWQTGVIWRVGHLRSDAGFTLLEVLIVCAITAGLIVAGSLSLSTAAGRLQLSRTTASVERGLLEAAGRARRTGRDQQVMLKREQDASIFVTRRSHTLIARPIEISWVAAAEASHDSEAGVIIFFGSGGASGGTLKLHSGSGASEIVVDWLTGAIRSRMGQS